MAHNDNNVINGGGSVLLGSGEDRPSETIMENSKGLKKGPWTATEDQILMDYVRRHGEGNWNSVQRNSGLNRCGKSCRLRWANHLRPNLKKGAFTPEEEGLILELHAKYANKWARMTSQLPGRTDNEIKNYWNTKVKSRQRQGLPLYPPDIKQSQQHSHSHSHSQSQPTTLTIPSKSSGMPPTGQTYSFRYQSSSSSHNSAFNQFDNPTDSSSFTFHRPSPVLGAPFLYQRYRDSHDISPPASPTPQRNGSILRTSFMPDISYNHHFAPGNMSMPDMASFQMFHPPSRNFNGSLPPLPRSTSTHFTQTSQSDHQITNHNETTHHCSNVLEELLQEAEALASVATPRKPGAIHHHHNHMNDSMPEDLS